ncbi:hypothetical protein GCM10010170_084560 [Dactylosporangium salmoneum]|uniref:Secreted protein n=1 Tax=Dactylosporangium salmoneum TaxID=53361 RepID=A0ABP5UEP2_9ACTN
MCNTSIRRCISSMMAVVTAAATIAVTGETAAAAPQQKPGSDRQQERQCLAIEGGNTNGAARLLVCVSIGLSGSRTQNAASPPELSCPKTRNGAMTAAGLPVQDCHH